MKPRLLLPMIMLLALISTAATAAHTRLHISSYDNAPIMVYVDGVEYGPFSNRHKLANLHPGIHNLRVVALYSNPYSVYNTQQQIFHGKVNVAPGYETHAVINPYNQLAITNLVALAPIGKPVLVTPVVTTGGTCGTPTPRPVGGGWVDPYPAAPLAMHPQEFAMVMQTIRDRSFDSGRRQVAQQIISQNFFTSAQIRDILGLFSFDSSRLEVAKFAYSRTVDPQFYYITYDMFSFDSSVNELSRFVAHS